MNTTLKYKELVPALLMIQSARQIVGSDGNKIEITQGLLYENIKELVKHELREIHTILMEKYEKAQKTVESITEQQEIEEFLEGDCEFMWDGVVKEQVLDFTSKNDILYDTKFIVKHFCKK